MEVHPRTRFTHPLDEERGDNLNSYETRERREKEEKKKKRENIQQGTAGRAGIKVGDASAPGRKNGGEEKNIEDGKSSCASVSPSILCCD